MGNTELMIVNGLSRLGLHREIEAVEKNAIRAPTVKCARVSVKRREKTLDTTGVVRDSAFIGTYQKDCMG